MAVTNPYPPAYDSLTMEERTAVRSVVERLRAIESVISLFWGGSTTLRREKDPLADVDLWLVVAETGNTPKKLCRDLRNLEGISFVHDAGYLPWLGHLVSLFFFHDCRFSIDVGVCEVDGLGTANPGPEIHVLWDDSEQVAQRLRFQLYERSAQERLADCVVNLVKIRKSLSRGCIWNAIEYLSRARREAMGLLRGGPTRRRIHYSRADRDIEEAISEAELGELAGTCPSYSSESVARCALSLVRIVLAWARNANVQSSLLPIVADLEKSISALIGKPEADRHELRRD